RFPALAAAPAFTGTVGLPGPAPDGALVLAWDDYARTQSANASQPDVLTQFHPLPLLRFDTQRPDQCSVTLPCETGEGNCDSDSECQTGLVCAAREPELGLAPDVNVCVAPHCANEIVDADETGLDCGGADCGQCLCGDGVVLALVGEECDDGGE